MAIDDDIKYEWNIDAIPSINNNRYTTCDDHALYIADDIETCLTECNLLKNGNVNKTMCISKYVYNKNNDIHCVLIDFGLNPKVFREKNNEIWNYHFKKVDYLKWYVVWFPIIILCSFISNNKTKGDNPIEYIIPQQFYKWCRKKTEDYHNHLLMLRYISCKRESNIYANNYIIFSKENDNSDYSNKLVEIYKLSKPHYFLPGETIDDIKNVLKSIPDSELDKIEY